MTYINAAAQCSSRRVALAVFLLLPALTLAGCGTANNVLGSGNGAPAVAAAPATQPVAAKPAIPSRAKVAIAPIIGAPDKVAQDLAAHLSTSVKKQQVAISSSRGETVDYTLRGYVVAARDRAGTKVSYIWDVTNQAGKRVKRITGEEVIRGGTGKDPWSAVSPAVMQKIANRTATTFGRWLPAKPLVASNGQPPSRSSVGAIGAGSQVAAVTKRPTTGSISAAKRPGSTAAIVMAVQGAPGDGGVSLTHAIQRQLAGKGVSLTKLKTRSTYSVQGRVSMGKPTNGKQSIKIEWFVRDPSGKSLGTVAQNNSIPQGSLDGAWGKTADAVASAAVQGIVKLLPRKTASR